MSGHESHGHGGGHGDHGHGHEDLKIVRPDITDEYMAEVNSRLHLSDEEEAIRKSIASGRLTPALEKEAHEMLESNRRKRAGAEYEKERALREVNQLIEDKKKKQKELDELDNALREHAASGNFRAAIQSKIDHALHEMSEINRKLEANKDNVADVEVIRDLDKARSEYAKEFKKYHKSIKTEKRIDDLKIGIFNTGTKIKNFFRKSGYKKDLLDKKDASEYETPEFKAKKEAYEVARLVLANRMYERRKQELMNASAITTEEAVEEIRKKELRTVEASGVHMSKDDKKEWERIFKHKIESGEYEDEINEIKGRQKIDPVEQIRRLKQYKAKEILQKTFFDEKKKLYEESGVPERTAALRLMHWYAKQPRWKKIALSTALFTAGGAMGAIPFASGMIAKYGILSYAGMRFGTSAIIGGAVANSVKGVDLWHYRSDKEKKEKLDAFKNKQKERFTSGQINQQQYEHQLERIQRKEDFELKKRMRIKAAVGVLLGAGAGAGAYHIIGDMMPADHDNVPPPMTKEPEKVIVNTEKAPTAPEPAPIPQENTPAQVNPENSKEYNLNQMYPREPAGPEIIMNPHREILERGGPAITSDVTPHTTADGIGAKNTNIQDHAPSVEKPKYNMGNTNPENESIKTPDTQSRTELPKTPSPESQVNPESGEKLNIPETKGNTEAPKIEEGTAPENTGVEGNGQTAAEYTKSLINQSGSKAENFRAFNNLSESSMKTILTPSDESHTRIVIEKSSPDLGTAQKMIDYDLRNIKAVSEDFKRVMDQKIYQDSNGYHVYEIIEIKK